MGMLDGGGGCRPRDARCNEYLLLPLLAIPFFGDADVIVIRRAFASTANVRVPKTVNHLDEQQGNFDSLRGWVCFQTH